MNIIIIIVFLPLTRGHAVMHFKSERGGRTLLAALYILIQRYCGVDHHSRSSHSFQATGHDEAKRRPVCMGSIVVPSSTLSLPPHPIAQRTAVDLDRTYVWRAVVTMYRQNLLIFSLLISKEEDGIYPLQTKPMACASRQ